jgi:UDP-N-acetylglucosamine--N-acetylmuramyl-(pentapeptide) pyrophosphoryl-undecaprenol N-acetylglucosamine transferase
VKEKKYIVVTGGGTGGHLSVARALIEEFLILDYKVIYIGSIYGQDKQWFENDEKIEQAYFLDTSGVVNKKGIKKFFSLYKILQAVVKVLQIFRKYQVKKIISVGGFSAAAASLAAIVTGKKLFIHEQNAVMGKLNQLTSKFAKEVFSSYSDGTKFKNYPVNHLFFQKSTSKTQIKTIIFLGGSQGAKAINDFALKIAPYLSSQDINIIHQTGKSDFQRVKEVYDELGIEADLFDFSMDLISKISQADFAISRSGAGTLWELCALNTPALFVPYPYAAANHQYHNAKFLEDKKLGYLSSEDNLSQELMETILTSNEIKQMSQGLKTTIQPNGAKEIAQFIDDY